MGGYFGKNNETPRSGESGPKLFADPCAPAWPGGPVQILGLADAGFGLAAVLSPFDRALADADVIVTRRGVMFLDYADSVPSDGSVNDGDLIGLI